jgi:hypothetical protein
VHQLKCRLVLQPQNQDVADLSIYRGVPEIAYSSEAPDREQHASQTRLPRTD